MDEQPSVETSAGRLWHLLEHVRRRMMSNTSIHEILSDFFAIDPDDQRRYQHLLRLAARMPDVVIEDVEALVRPPMPRALLLKNIDRVPGFFVQMELNPAAVVSDIVMYFPTDAMDPLANAAFILQSESEIGTVDEDSFAQLRMLAENVISVLSAETAIPVQLRRTLLRHAHEILRAIDDYRVSGFVAAMDATDGMIGRLAQSGGSIPPESPVWTAVKRLTQTVAVVASLAVLPVQIGQGLDFLTSRTLPAIEQLVGDLSDS